MTDLPDDAPKNSQQDAERFVTLESARWRLASVWFPAAALIFLILIGQSLFGAYGEDMQRAWGWALPNFLPTTALIISVFAADAFAPYSETETLVRKSFSRLALGLSIFYVATILFSLLVQPFVGNPTNAEDPIQARLELLEASNLWLAPLQSLVVAALGVLFFLKKTKGPE